MGRVKLEDGSIVEVIDLDVVGPASKSVEFKLSDGSKFKVLVTLTRTWRAKDAYTETGEPMYGGNINVTRNISVPAELYQKEPKPSEKKPYRGIEVA